MPSSWTQNYYHMVFSTHRREPWIDPELHDRLYAFMGGICRDLGSQLVVGNGMPDHVHLLIRFAPDVAPAVLAREVKARSSRWIHETFPKLREATWQRGYGGFTVSRSAIDEVDRYIREQHSHHERLSFKDEFEALLRKHGIEFDARYMLE
jgi:REP element-mobilizing transposase RayT